MDMEIKVFNHKKTRRRVIEEEYIEQVYQVPMTQEQLDLVHEILYTCVVGSGKYRPAADDLMNAIHEYASKKPQSIINHSASVNDTQRVKHYVRIVLN